MAKRLQNSVYCKFFANLPDNKKTKELFLALKSMKIKCSFPIDYCCLIPLKLTNYCLENDLNDGDFGHLSDWKIASIAGWEGLKKPSNFVRALCLSSFFEVSDIEGIRSIRIHNFAGYNRGILYDRTRERRGKDADKPGYKPDENGQKEKEKKDKKTIKEGSKDPKKFSFDELDGSLDVPEVREAYEAFYKVKKRKTQAAVDSDLKKMKRFGFTPFQIVFALLICTEKKYEGLIDLKRTQSNVDYLGDIGKATKIKNYSNLLTFALKDLLPSELVDSNGFLGGQPRQVSQGRGNGKVPANWGKGTGRSAPVATSEVDPSSEPPF